LSPLRNPNAIRSMCLTIRLQPSLGAFDRPVSIAPMIGCCHVSTVVARVWISGALQAAATV
jgi:hypothetical protein